MNFNHLLLNTIVTGALFTILINGITASADELVQTGTITYDNLSTCIEEVYPIDRFNLSTVSASDVDDSSLTLEEYLVQEMRKFNSSIDISKYSVDSTQLSDVLNKINLTYPDIFYLEMNYRFSLNSVSNTVVKLVLEYTCTEDEYNDIIQMIDNKFEEIISIIDDSMSDYEKALLIHDYICTNFAYDSEGTDGNHKLDEFVEEGVGVCQAYMSAYIYILDKVGIKSYPVVSNAIGHTWNIVLLDGNYYQIDVTWDDFVPDLLGWADHTNFLLTDDQVSSSNHGDQWFIYEDSESVCATDDTFSSYNIKSLKFPVIYLDGSLYCIDKGIFSEYNFIEDTMTPITDILSNEKWYNYNSSLSNVYYREKYSSLNVYKDIIFYNSSTEVIAMDVNGNIIDTIYSREASKDSIYGITIKDGFLLAQIEISLNAEADEFGQNIVTVCDVEEWYQQYLSGALTTVDNTSESTTTETTTITTVTTVSDNIINNYNLDMNSDGYVNGLDILILKSYILLENEDFSYSLIHNDVNNDGSINILDILVLKNTIINMKE